MSMSPKDYLNLLQEVSGAKGEKRHAAQQLLVLNDEARRRPNGMFLELGTDRGQASRAILAGCEDNGGRLVSVDIRDCSTAVSSENWKFVRSNSIDRETILRAAPELLAGIDFVYVDSLHTAEHVTREVYTWFDLIKEGGVLFFDDIDSGPYLSGRRKDNPVIEIDNRQIKNALENIFYSNLDTIDFHTIYGSTGLGVIRKKSGLGEKLLQPYAAGRRNNYTLARLQKRLGSRFYRHTKDGTDFLIPME